MSALGGVVSRLHRRIQQNGSGGESWAAQLQQRMQQEHLTESGRLLSHALRPHFVSGAQLETIAHFAAAFGRILDQFVPALLTRPDLVNQIGLLPVEKALIRLDPGYSEVAPIVGLSVQACNQSFRIAAVETCRPRGLTYANCLKELFLSLPFIEELDVCAGSPQSMRALDCLPNAVLRIWKQFAANGAPKMAVVDWPHADGQEDFEAKKLARFLSSHGFEAKLLAPESLSFQRGILSHNGEPIQAVLRRVRAAELLTRSDLSQPLLEAYRSRSVCVINSFRSEICQRRSFLELLTDDAVTAMLNTNQRELLAARICWTRVLKPRRISYQGEQVDLLDWVIKNRPNLTLLPDDPHSSMRAYTGHAMTPPAWAYAVRQALRSAYVVQERPARDCETFPFLQYGKLEMRDVEATLWVNVLSGHISGMIAALEGMESGIIKPQGVAPVLVLEQ